MGFRDSYYHGIPIEVTWKWEHKYAKNGNVKTARDNGNGNSYFFMCAKVPIGRLDANAIQ